MAVTARTLRLAREVRKILTGLLDSLTRTLTAGWAKAWDRLAGRFAVAVKGLLATNGGKWPSRRQVNQSPELNDVLAAAAAEHDELVDLLRTRGSAAATKAARAASAAQSGLIDSQLPSGHNLRVGQVSDGALDAIANRTARRITTLSGHITRDVIAAIRDELVRGIRSGDSPEEVARLILSRAEARWSGGLGRAATIAHTEVADSFRQASMIAQLAARDVLRGWTWICQLRPNSCGACWAMHGSEHPLDEPGPDDHPNGKCTRGPLTKTWKELGFDFPETPSLLPDAQTAFAALSRSQQLAVMGPTRLDLLDRGEISWADLATRRENPGWRPSITTTPVRDLIPS